jgi:hypothetical protein
VDPAGLRRVIETNLPYARLGEALIPLNIMATNQQGQGVRLSSGPSIEAILASAAIPGVFPPVHIDGEALMDGAIAANTPVRLAAELGASRIIILPTGYARAPKEPPRTVIGKALHAITLMIAWQLMYELELAEEIDVHLMPTLCPLAVSPFDFSASKSFRAPLQGADGDLNDGAGSHGLPCRRPRVALSLTHSGKTAHNHSNAAEDLSQHNFTGKTLRNRSQDVHEACLW